MDFKFKPLNIDDLKLIEKWYQNPHVREFWDPGLSWDEARKKFAETLKSPSTYPFIIYYKKFPVGLIQYYLVGENPPLPEINPDAVGIDLFIGEEYLTRKGLGPKIIRNFMKLIELKQGSVQVITDPVSHNIYGISAFKKSGFLELGKVPTGDGGEYLYLSRA